MKSIAYLVVYFGKLPDMFDAWLRSCKYNPSVDFLLYLDDHTSHDYPNNVKVKYISFQVLKEFIQAKYQFEIFLENPYRLCDYKVAYGDIFSADLKQYDFWGYCDIDMIFGDIREFITDEILDNYSKIGCLGHSTLYRNTPEISTLYKSYINGEEIYKKIFTTKGKSNCFFDEKWINVICENSNIKTYTKTIFADLIPWSWRFQLGYVDAMNFKKNERRIFTWENGKLFSYSFYKAEVCKDEFMYIHFLKRNMNISWPKNVNTILIIPNKIVALCKKVTEKDIIKYSKNKMLLFWFGVVKSKWRKITFHNVVNYMKIRHKAKKHYNYEKKDSNRKAEKLLD